MEVKVSPSMAGIATDTAGDAQEAGLTTEEMLKQMIVDPNAEIAGGFQPNLMPQDWGEKLTPQQLNDLIAYLMTVVQRLHQPDAHAGAPVVARVRDARRPPDERRGLGQPDRHAGREPAGAVPQ